eukprot:s3472_g4.t1
MCHCCSKNDLWPLLLLLDPSPLRCWRRKSHGARALPTSEYLAPATSKLGSQSLDSRTTVLVNDDSVFQKPPCAIDDLRARLHGDGAVGAGNLVLHEFDVARLQPTKLAIHLDPLLGMDHTIVKDPFDLQLVRLCRVSMENNTTFVQELVAECFPL